MSPAARSLDATASQTSMQLLRELCKLLSMRDLRRRHISGHTCITDHLGGSCSGCGLTGKRLLLIICCWRVQVLSTDIDLLHPPAEIEKQKHKTKRLVQSPNSFFMDVKCQGCFQMCVLYTAAASSFLKRIVLLRYRVI